MCTLGTTGSLLTFTAPANVIVTVIRVYFHCEKPSKQGLFGESVAKLFLVFNAHFGPNFYPQFEQILMNQFAEALSLNQPQEC